MAGGPGDPKSPPGSGLTTPDLSAFRDKGKKKARHGLTWVVLLLLREEVLAKDPRAKVPTVEDVVAADHAGDLTTPEARRLLATLYTESTRLGLDFPASLAPTEVAPAAVATP
jgi:hypothetical protein